MSDPISLPETLCRYFPFETKEQMRRVRALLLESKLFFSSPAAFNDPFDCVPSWSNEIPEEEVRSYWERQLRRRPELNEERVQERIEKILGERLDQDHEVRESLIRHFQTEINAVGICCFSKPPNHLLLWAHYASGHRGVCVEFATHPRPLRTALDVKYRRHRPPVRYTDSDKHRLFDATFLTKSKLWDYEEEWRVLDYKAGPGIKVLPSGSIERVIGGCAMDADDRHMLARWVDKASPRPRLAFAEQSAGTYHLHIADAAREGTS